MSKTPSILAFVPEGWTLRPVQRDALLKVEAAWQKYDVIVIPLSVGGGKSLLIRIIMAWRQAIEDSDAWFATLLTQVMLQRQYANDFPDVPVLKGRNRYECSTMTHGRAPNPNVDPKKEESCQAHKDLTEHYCTGCPYTRAKGEITSLGRGVFNFYSYMMFDHVSYPSAMFIDEAQNVTNVMFEFFTKTLYKCVTNYGKVETIGDALIYFEREYHQCMSDLSIALEHKRLMLELNDEYQDADQDRRIKDLKNEVRSYTNFLEGIKKSPSNFFLDRVQTQYRGTPTEALRLTPTTLRGLMDGFFHHSINKIVMLSGTINELDTAKMGLGNRRITFLDDLEAPIPVSQRPVTFLPSGNMGFKYQHISMPMVAKKIQELADKHPSEKGLVHIPYSLQEKFRELLGDGRFLWHDKKTKDKVYKKFRESDQPLILMASGMAEGIDLPYDAGRWQIITKVMWPSLADGLNKHYMEFEPDWYAWMTVKQIVQQSGRICRGPTDYGATYILDSGFKTIINRYRRLFPKYFLDALTTGASK